MTCPACKQDITELIEICSASTRTPVFLSKYYNSLNSGEIEVCDESEVIHYECPGCEEVICYSADEAEKLLKGI